jgi:hypothetical protein
MTNSGIRMSAILLASVMGFAGPMDAMAAGRGGGGGHAGAGGGHPVAVEVALASAAVALTSVEEEAAEPISAAVRAAAARLTSAPDRRYPVHPRGRIPPAIEFLPAIELCRSTPPRAAASSTERRSIAAGPGRPMRG